MIIDRKSILWKQHCFSHPVTAVVAAPSHAADSNTAFVGLSKGKVKYYARKRVYADESVSFKNDHGNKQP